MSDPTSPAEVAVVDSLPAPPSARVSALVQPGATDEFRAWAKKNAPEAPFRVRYACARIATQGFALNPSEAAPGDDAPMAASELDDPRLQRIVDFLADDGNASVQGAIALSLGDKFFGVAAAQTAEEALPQEVVEKDMLFNLMKALPDDKLEFVMNDPVFVEEAMGRAAKVARAGTFVRSAPKVGRNQPCPCGSGKKSKKCCENA